MALHFVKMVLDTLDTHTAFAVSCDSHVDQCISALQRGRLLVLPAVAVLLLFVPRPGRVPVERPGVVRQGARECRGGRPRRPELRRRVVVRVVPAVAQLRDLAHIDAHAAVHGLQGPADGVQHPQVGLVSVVVRRLAAELDEVGEVAPHVARHLPPVGGAAPLPARRGVLALSAEKQGAQMREVRSATPEVKRVVRALERT